MPSTREITGFGEARLIDAVAGGLRMERAACARRIFAAAELFFRREEQQPDREQWRIDGWESVAVEVGAAQGISRFKAGAQVQLGVCLREELPLVGAKFADGLVDYWVVDTIMNRVALLSPADKARIDEALADAVASWNRLSKKKVIALVDSWVVQLDALAKREPRNRDQDRYLWFGPAVKGMAEMNASLRATTAAAVQQRVAALIGTVCDQDPRTADQRRADALDAMAVGADRMACECDREDCSAAMNPPAVPVVIHVVADAATVHGDAAIPGYLPGYGALPADLVRAYIRTARLKPVPLPRDLATCEPGYRASAALTTYVKLRDVTCRFPGCDAPAEVCDLDHSVPWPYGPTHPSNIKLLCRVHHMVKTFVTGPAGWRDSQHPDGTVTWTAPTGHTYTTTPTGAQFFPQFAVKTANVTVLHYVRDTDPGRAGMMPRRARTRRQDRQARIDDERARNQQRLQAEGKPQPPQCFTGNTDPPPF